MPQNKHALIRYYIIDDLLHRFDYVKTSLMLEFCQRKTGYSISQRTIQLDINAMKYDSFLGFFAPIEYCKKNKSYYYSNLEYNLIPFQFTQEEVLFLEYIYAIIKTKLSPNEYIMFNQIILKIKTFSIDCNKDMAK